MKKYFLLSVWLYALTSISFGQFVNFEDGFEDGNFTAIPSWDGDDGEFTVKKGTPNFMLQLQGDSENGGVSYLSTASTRVEGSWEFFIDLDFNPSAGNRADIFLMSDIANLEGPLNGYALRAGESGSSDVFKIVRYDDGSQSATVLSGTTDISSGGSFRLKATRQSDGRWTLEVAQGYDGLLMQEGGTGEDNTHTSAHFFGVRATYTSSRANKFLFDFKIDLPPFTFTKIVPDDQTVAVTFNRAYDQASVEASDFSLNKGLGSPRSIRFPSTRVVRLIYAEALPSNKYILHTQGITDHNGVRITATSQNFMVFGVHATGDIIINEFLYDPPGPLAEYVELKNTSSKYLDISGWKIGDQSGIDELETDPLAIEPDSFLVITADTSALHSIFGSRAYRQFSELASFNNNGDVVRLINDTGSLVDSLTYTPEWGGEDVALERRSDSAPSTLRANFSDSPHRLGGTPGADNEVLADNTAPTLKTINILDHSTISLVFSEALAPSASTDKHHYTIHPTRNIQLISLVEDTVTLFLSQPLQSGAAYQITISGLQDVFGNIITETSRQPTYTAISEARPGDVVINEMLYMSQPSDDPEFIELYNATNQNFDLSNWTLSDARTTSSLTGGTQLLASEYLVITGDRTLANQVDHGIYLSDFPSLNDTEDTIYIQSDSGTTIDSLFYDDAFVAGKDGISAERIDPKAASNDPSNFAFSTDDRGSTPGQQNSIFQHDETPPELVFARLTPTGDIEVRFNEFISLSSEPRFLINGQVLAIHSFDPTSGNSLYLNTTKEIIPGSELTIQAERLSDVKGNITNFSQITVAQQLSPGDVVVNEIMYNPLSDSDDNQPDQREYIELRNTRDFAISLEDVTLRDAPDENGEIRTIYPVTTGSKWIPAQSTALIFADEAVSFEQSQTAKFFTIPRPAPHILIRVDRSSLSLASSGDAIYLADRSGTAVDSVFYDESWQNPNLVDTRGIALERISPAGNSNDKNNWGSSVNPKGGTPGSENSIHQTATTSLDETGISFSPNPFSPDDDGYEDNLFINYKLEQSDYLLKVRIYDRYGRLVKELADGKQAGFEGTLIWDGRKDEGRRNRIGIYIVVFEAFNSTSGNDRTFKKTAVLARRLN